MDYRKTAAFLTAVMICAGGSAGVPVSETGMNMKELFSVHAAETGVIEEGTLGPDVTYKVYSDGKMVVSGSGEITKRADIIENKDFIVSLSFENDEKNGSVTEIPAGGFAGMTNLETVSLPDGLRKIGKEAFAYCRYIEEVKIPDSVVFLDERVFAECENLKKAELPSGTGIIIPEIFNRCYSLEEITMPVLGTAYSGVSAEEVHVDSKVADMFEVTDDILTEYSLRKINIKDGAEAIPDFEFRGLRTLTEVNIPESVTSIGRGAFIMTGIESVELPEKLEEIGEAAFAATELKEISLPDGLRKIGKEAFAYCRYIEEVKIPDSVVYLDERVFAECEKLKKAELPSGTGIIIPEIFNRCFSLEEITMPVLGTAYSGVFAEEVHVDSKVADMFEVTDDILTEYSLRKINIKDGAEAIPDFEFRGLRTLTEVNIPESVTSIGRGAFIMTGIESVELPEKLEEIREAAFAATELKEISLPDGLRKIGKEAFAYCRYIEEVKIPDSVVYLDERVFAECEKLKKAELPSGTGIIIPEIFNRCFSLEEITMPVLGTAYSGISAEEVHVDSKVADMFEVTDDILTEYSLRKINIKDGAEAIPDFEFRGLRTLTEVNIPESVTSIGRGAFIMTGIESVKLPEKLEEIGEAAFAATDLNDIYMYNNIRRIEKEAFFECRKLTDINFSGTEDDWNSIFIDEEGNESFNRAAVHFGATAPENSGEPAPEEAEKFRGDGDVNSDGVVDITDLTYISLYNLHDIELSETAIIRGDMTLDGKISLTDLATLKMKLSHQV